MLAGDALHGQVALVTGGGTGLGRAIAVELARAGCAVGIVSRDAQHRAAGITAVEAVGGRCAEAECDVRDADQINAAFDQIEAALGPVTILVNNAAANFPQADLLSRHRSSQRYCAGIVSPRRDARRLGRTSNARPER